MSISYGKINFTKMVENMQGGNIKIEGGKSCPLYFHVQFKCTPKPLKKNLSTGTGRQTHGIRTNVGVRPDQPCPKQL
jgi:hypothetical protein